MGNLGATHTSTLGAEMWLTTVGTLNANHVETIAGRAAGKFVFLRLVQDATGGRTLQVSDGTTPVSVTVNSAASAPTDILIACKDSTDFDVIVLGAGAQPPWTISNTTGLQAALDGKQPLDSDLTAIAALTTTTYGRSLLALADAAAARTSLSAVSDTDLRLTGASLNTQTGDYTLALSDAGKVVEINSASAQAITVPTNASVAFPVGSLVEVRQYGAGAVTVAAAGGVTVNSPDGMLAVGHRFGSVSLHKRATNEWILTGDLA